jgi:hypothetical protein
MYILHIQCHLLYLLTFNLMISFNTGNSVHWFQVKSTMIIYWKMFYYSLFVLTDEFVD